MSNKVGGLIAYFDLEEWWLSEFTAAERHYIGATFGGSLAEGEISDTSQTIGGLLNSLSGWFHKTEQDAVIAEKIRRRAMQEGLIDQHFSLSGKLDYLLREHLYAEASAVSREMVNIAAAVASEMQGRPPFKGNLPCHAGYDHLTDKGYLVGDCDSGEAIQLCEKAASEGWFGEWDERIEEIKDFEEALATAKAIIRANPDILQSDLLKQYTEVGSQTLYYAEMRGAILRVKKGRSYTLQLAE